MINLKLLICSIILKVIRFKVIKFKIQSCVVYFLWQMTKKILNLQMIEMVVQTPVKNLPNPVHHQQNSTWKLMPNWQTSLK